jgi:hypothetical protein
MTARLNQVPVSCAALDPADVAAELVASGGNVSAAAKKFDVPTGDLRKLVWSSSSLVDLVYEELEQAADEARQVLLDGLRSDDEAWRLKAAVTLLTQTEAGRRRGWGRGDDVVER